MDLRKEVPVKLQHLGAKRLSAATVCAGSAAAPPLSFQDLDIDWGSLTRREALRRPSVRAAAAAPKLGNSLRAPHPRPAWPAAVSVSVGLPLA